MPKLGDPGRPPAATRAVIEGPITAPPCDEPVESRGREAVRGAEAASIIQVGPHCMVDPGGPVAPSGHHASKV
eukprot:14902186-Alexandrium_andersonii.AAC.1